MPDHSVLPTRPFPGSRRVTALGLGLAALGRPGYINLGHAEDTRDGRSVEAMRDRAFQVLDRAWAGGLRYFDTARSYGRGEQFLGDWLRTRAIDPQAVKIASKWGYTYTADWQIEAEHHEIKDHSLSVLRRQWQETDANLHGYLNLYQIHSATLDSGVLADPDVHAELARIKDRGVFVGLTLSGPRQAEVLDMALGLRVDGERLFDTVQATWNLLEPSAGPSLEQAHQEGLGVIVKEALANGRLTARNQAPDFGSQRQVLDALARRFDSSPDAVALAAALARPWAAVILSGAATEAHLRSNLSALAIRWDAEAESSVQELAENAGHYWKTRSQLTWN